MIIHFLLATITYGDEVIVPALSTAEVPMFQWITQVAARFQRLIQADKVKLSMSQLKTKTKRHYS